MLHRIIWFMASMPSVKPPHGLDTEGEKSSSNATGRIGNIHSSSDDDSTTLASSVNKTTKTFDIGSVVDFPLVVHSFCLLKNLLCKTLR
jgi:hypothetical protein